MYNGVKCGDIKGENGLCYCAPSSYTGLDGSIKEYVVDNDVEIQMAPDKLFELIKFTKYEKSTNATKKPILDKGDKDNIPEESNLVVEEQSACHAAGHAAMPCNIRTILPAGPDSSWGPLTQIPVKLFTGRTGSFFY